MVDRTAQRTENYGGLPAGSGIEQQLFSISVCRIFGDGGQDYSVADAIGERSWVSGTDRGVSDGDCLCKEPGPSDTRTGSRCKKDCRR